MRKRLMGIVKLIVIVVLGALVPASLIAQQSVPDSTAAPRLPDGRPDLQGVWDFGSVTPLQRPSTLADKEFLTEEDVSALEAQAAARVDRPPRPGDPGSYNRFWFADGTKVVGTRRTSLIVDPPDGRLPAYAAEGEARMAAREEARRRNAGPEDRDVDERCILGFNSGPPMNPSAYNNNMQLFQTGDHVVVLNEMVHDARIIPLDRSFHLPAAVHQWRGDSRGHWDGDTLVIETKNFTNQTSFRGSGPNMLLIERFTRVAPDMLIYGYTVHDADSFARSWSVSVQMQKSDQALFEYACHEGNYGLLNMLRGARSDDGK